MTRLVIAIILTAYTSIASAGSFYSAKIPLAGQLSKMVDSNAETIVQQGRTGIIRDVPSQGDEAIAYITGAAQMYSLIRMASCHKNLTELQLQNYVRDAVAASTAEIFLGRADADVTNVVISATNKVIPECKK